MLMVRQCLPRQKRNMSLIREHIVKRFRRSSGWSAVRKEYLRHNPVCAVCGSRKRREVHHIFDFSTSPSMELDWLNLVTLCRKHHILFGHLNFWQSINPSVMRDCSNWRYKIENRR